MYKRWLQLTVFDFNAEETLQGFGKLTRGDIEQAFSDTSHIRTKVNAGKCFIEILPRDKELEEYLDMPFNINMTTGKVVDFKLFEVYDGTDNYELFGLIDFINPVDEKNLLHYLETGNKIRLKATFIKHDSKEKELKQIEGWFVHRNRKDT